MTPTEIDTTIDQVRLTKVGDLSTFTAFRCLMCDHELLPEGFEPTYEELTKLGGWTVAQLMAFRNLQKRSGGDYRELLAGTSGGVMPGIGGAINGDVGTIGVNNFHGMFVGIEPDGYTHS